MAYKFPCEPVGSPYDPPGTYGYVMLRSSLLQNSINMMERYGIKGVVENLRELLFRDGKRVNDESELPWNLFPDVNNPVRRPDKYFSMITDRPWRTILGLIREVDREVACIVEGCLVSDDKGGGVNNPNAIGLNGKVSNSHDTPDNVRADVSMLQHRSYGNSRAAALSRLKKDAPELFDRVVAGELSANAAAIEAGFRKKPTPIDIIKSNWKKLSADERVELMNWLNDQV